MYPVTAACCWCSHYRNKLKALHKVNLLQSIPGTNWCRGFFYELVKLVFKHVLVPFPGAGTLVIGQSLNQGMRMEVMDWGTSNVIYCLIV